MSLNWLASSSSFTSKLLFIDFLASIMVACLLLPKHAHTGSFLTSTQASRYEDTSYLTTLLASNC